MTDYLIIYIDPFSHKILHDIEKDFKKAIIKSKSIKHKKRGQYYDVIIVERTQGELGEFKYVLKNYGYGNVYYVMNKLIFYLVFFSLLFILYLYIHYQILKN